MHGTEQTLYKYLFFSYSVMVALNNKLQHSIKSFIETKYFLEFSFPFFTLLYSICFNIRIISTFLPQFLE